MPTPTEADIRAAIKTKLDSVNNMGVVHDYERYSKQPDDFRELYVAEINGVNQVRGWYIRRISRHEGSDYVARYEVIINWRIQGYMSLKDDVESEKVFDSLVETLADEFRTDETLGGVVDSIIVGDDAGLQVEDAGPVMFTGILCHSARCRLTTRHYL